MTDAKEGRFPVVGIGASAGGIEAFKGFFENMPPGSGLCFVVVLHLPADRKSILPEILSRWTSMPIAEATDGRILEPNCIYVPPPGVIVTFENGRLHLHRLGADEPRELNPITMLFNSLATALHEDAIGVILSGTGSDGALGLKAIKEEGGLTLVQGSDGSAPQHGGMPASAIATGAVDIVAPVERLPGHIIDIREARQKTESLAALSEQQIREARLAICAVLERQLGHDFSNYKDRTFLRRVQRRMQVLGLTSLDAFIDRLRRDRNEVRLLFRDLLIGVTSFFRDEDTFELLKKAVIPGLFNGADNNRTIRVWVPGCATGEEAYSLAMLLREYADGLDSAPKIQVFATDIDEPAIATARAGRYPSTLLRGLSPERLSRFFVHGVDGSFMVAKQVRELCTFSAHSLIRDPPFSRIDLLSCRNLLIYLDVDLQGVVIPAFHYSLVPNGILLLGSAETVNRHEGLFSTIDRSHRIFQKRDVPSPPLRVAGRGDLGRSAPGKAAVPAPDGGASRIGNARASNWASTQVLERFAPPYVVVTAQGSSVQYSSRVTQYLELPAGVPNHNVIEMARKGLRAPLRAALKQAVQTGTRVESAGALVTGADSKVHRLTLTVEPRVEPNGSPMYLIVFLEAGPHRPAARKAAEGETVAEAPADPQLEAELRDTREQLQSVVEEHDTALEELRSANEELHSVNEELQSTNEELETSKEEIQSINEELQTVNAQLASKIDELDHNNSDLKNLFESTHVATIFLDPYLIIRSFTPAVASIYNLIPSDQGRPLTDIVSSLDYPGLTDDCHQVLQTLQPLERRVARSDASSHYLMKVVPYRTPESVADGVIMTFVDVTSIVQAETHQRLLVDELNHRVRNMLSVVISMATQTMRRSGSMEEFSKNYTGRVHALSAAYALLSDQGWKRISLEDVVMVELRPFQSNDRQNIVVHGSHVLLEPQAALALGMGIHELTTNAVKYGALSTFEGHVDIRWRVERNEGQEQVVLEWVERGGPPVVTPVDRGFGMTLIERGLRQDMGADVRIEFASSGVVATLVAPLPQVSIEAPHKSAS
ncbi:MAG TPA: CheR family methyltransferase [Roseiarcus sp.]